MNGQVMGGQTVASTVALAGAGDEAAFARLVVSYHADMARVAFTVCGDRELAEDAVQSAWLVAWRKLHSLRDPDRVRPWLLAVTANEARQIVRRRRGTRRLFAVLAVTLLLAGCAASASQTTVPGTPAPATPVPATPTPAPAASTPTPSAVAIAAAADRTYVSGTMGCEAIKETPISERLVRITFDCPFEMSDPRVTGSQPMECDEGFYDLPELPGGVGIWDTCSMVLTGQGGTWKAVAAYGSEFMKSGTVRTSGTQIYEGQGAFAGLRFVALFSASPELAGLYGDGYHVSGWIEPAD